MSEDEGKSILGKVNCVQRHWGRKERSSTEELKGGCCCCTRNKWELAVDVVVRLWQVVCHAWRVLGIEELGL